MTKEEFILKSKEIHCDKYDYSCISNGDTIRYHDYVDNIICKLHGPFRQKLGNHLIGQNCPICGKIKRNGIMTKDDFVKKARKVHGDKYDYSKVEYVNSSTKVCIIYPGHGEFWQSPNAHLSGHGYKETIEDFKENFIKKAKEIHGDKFDYSKVEYVNSSTKVCIVCPEHGEFWQTPDNHISGNGCPKCSGRYKLTTEEFIRRAKEIHGDKYDYSKVEYVNNSTKVCIICPEHGEFWQTPGHHISGEGCFKCGRKVSSDKQTLTTDDFIEVAKKIHGDKYDYSKVEYTGYENYVTIGCPIHGYFKQSPDSHLHSGGCPKCGSTLSKNEDEIFNIFKNIVGEDNIEQRNRHILGNKEIDIYFPNKKIGIEYNGLYWHSDKNKRITENYHLNKTLLCRMNGIKLIQIFEDEYINHKDIVISKLKHTLGLDTGMPKIPGRKCEVKIITKQISEDFLEKYHIQGFVRATVHLGCYYNDKLIAVMSFLKLKNNSWELVRFASDYNYTCQGVGGKLFKYFVRNYNPEEIKSFADRRWTVNETNNVYLSLGFKFDSYTNPDYRYYNEKVNQYERIHKFNFRKKILNKKYGLPLSMTENEMTTKLGYYKIWDCGLIKYIWKKE